MLKRRIEQRESLVTEDVVCNKCGRSCRVGDQGEGFGFQSVELKPWWGYHSSKDGEVHRSHLCEGCYDTLVATFAIAPEVRHYLVGDPIDPFDPEVELRRQAREKQ